MLFFRSFIFISSVILVWGYAKSIMAEEIFSHNLTLDLSIKPTTKTSTANTTSSVATKPIAQSSATNTKPIAQSSTTNSTSPANPPTNTSLDYANPSSNPLLLPNQPSEVDIKNLVPITLERAVKLALDNNKDLQASRIALARAKDQLNEALAAEYPTLDAEVDLTRTETNNVGTTSDIFGGRQTTVNNNIERDLTSRIALNYDLYTGGRRGAQIRQAEKQIRVNELEVETVSEQTRFEATRDYYRLQTADAAVGIEQARVADAIQTLRDAQLLEQAGLGTRFDVLRAEVEVANANQALTRAIADQRTARRTLAETLNLSQDTELTAGESIKEAGVWGYSLQESITLAYKNRAELEQQLVQREIGEQDQIIALADTQPQVGLSADYRITDSLDDAYSPFDRSAFVLSATMRWRFFDGGRAQSRADQAQKDVENSENSFALLKDQIRLEVETSYFDATANKQNIQTTQQAVITATESLRLARLRFQAGVGTQTDVISSQTELTTARGNFLRAINDYNQALNSLQRAVSNLPDNRLFELR